MWHGSMPACARVHNCIHDHSGCRLSAGRGPLPRPRKPEPVSDAGLDCILENGMFRQPQGSWHLSGDRLLSGCGWCWPSKP